jgi:hypothetical protein
LADERSYKGEIDASEILAKIEKGGDVEYDNVIIKGNLDISGHKLPEENGKPIINSKISIKNSRFDGFVNFASTIFKNNIRFSGTIFDGIDRNDISATDFRSASFNGDANFERASFSRSNVKSASHTSCPGTANFERATFSKRANFIGATFGGYANFSNASFSGGANFERATFSKRANFIGATFGGYANFSNATFSGDTNIFNSATFSRIANFRSASFSGDANFSNATFSGGANFESATFSGVVNFSNASFSGDANIFIRATFGRIANFSNATFFRRVANFSSASFSGDANFESAVFGENFVSFRDTKFRSAKQQEPVCRGAKVILEKIGDRDEAGHNFYKEMEAKRRQKSWYWRYPEYFFIQLMFGYGVHPFRLMGFWLLMVSLFALIFGWLEVIKEGNWQAYTWFSISTAVTPGYAGYKFDPGSKYQIIAGIEAILGTFMWAAFIATFARKFMR